MIALRWRISRGFGQIRSARVCWILTILLIGIFAWTDFTGGYAGNKEIYSNFGLQLPKIQRGWIWQLESYGFLHGSWAHVLMNCACLLLLGSRLEWMLGWRMVLATALAGVFFGGISHLAIGVTHHSLLVGFSGGCMASLLLLCTISPDSRMAPLGISARNLGLCVLFLELALALIDPAKQVPFFSIAGQKLQSLSGSIFQMGHACHFGGSLAGWVIGRWLLRPRVTLESLQRERRIREG